ncbi:Two-component response regulator [Minicystis rosea]|nr:Two-component response regulator [Minicystis rosea]
MASSSSGTWMTASSARSGIITSDDVGGDDARYARAHGELDRTMPSAESQEQLAAGILLAAAEVVTYEDFGEILPRLGAMLDARGAFFYRSEAEHPIVPVAGTLLPPMTPEYLDAYYQDDPLQRAVHRDNPRIFFGSRCPEWAAYRAHRARDFFRRHDVEYFLHVRLHDGGHHAPGASGMVVVRAACQPDFADDDALLLGRIYPALSAAARRGSRSFEGARTRSIMESALESAPRPLVALDLGGRVIWASPRGERLLASRTRRRALEAALGDAARRIAAPSLASLPPANVAVRVPGGPPLRIELRLCRPASGAPFVLAEIDAGDPPPPLAALAARHGLTRAEAKVLDLVARGQRDREIAARQRTSLATVRTHVSRVLSKLGVRSRVEATLIARGAPVERESV